MEKSEPPYWEAFKILILPIIAVIFVILLSGCSTSQTIPPTGNQKNQIKQGTTTEQTTAQPMPDYPLRSKQDLSVGTKLLVMGASNADGSMFADRIFIGTTSTDFNIVQMGFGPGSGVRQASGTPAEISNNGNQESSVNNGSQNYRNRTTPPDFTNMNAAERQAMQQRRASQPASGGSRQSGFSRLIGEVLNMDDTSITISLDQGGTKIVFITDTTKIFLVPASE